MSKKDKLKNLIKRLHDGESEEVITREFKEEFGHVTSKEISELEQELIMEGTTIEEIQKLCNVHANVFTGSIEDLHSLDEIDSEIGHPLFIFRRENQGIADFIKNKVNPALDAYVLDDSENNRIDLIAQIKELSKVDKHYSRKENLLFPYLEKAGITGPPQVMWGKDDEIRAMLKAIQFEDFDKDTLVSKVHEATEEVESMIFKENDILSPLLVDNIKFLDWLLIASESHIIGYVFNGGIEGASPSDAAYWLDINSKKLTLPGEDPAAEVTEESVVEAVEEGYIKFPSGLIKYEDLILMLNHSPQDFTYIDKDDKVAYFSEGKHMVFPRTRTVIGRDVRHCHPPKTLPVLNRMLAEFKTGAKDSETRYLFPGTKVLLVRYFAVRDENNEYIGTLETTEEISEIIDAVNEQRNQ